MYIAAWMAVIHRRHQEKDTWKNSRKLRWMKIGVGADCGGVSGRYYAMDRDNRWDRVEQAYQGTDKGRRHRRPRMSLHRQGLRLPTTIGVTDEFVLPTVDQQKTEQPVAAVTDGDSVVFFNFRPDRAREITRAILCRRF